MSCIKIDKQIFPVDFRGSRSVDEEELYVRSDCLIHLRYFNYLPVLKQILLAIDTTTCDMLVCSCTQHIEEIFNLC